MNLRISQNELRFRLSQEELTRLCSANSLDQTTPLPSGRSFQISIGISAGAGVPLHVDLEDDRLLLTVDAVAAQALLESLPNRDGLAVKQQLDDGRFLELQLEIDIRTQKRSRSDQDRA